MTVESSWMYSLSKLAENGFALLPDIVSGRETEALIAAFENSRLHSTRAGIRHALQDGRIASFAQDPRLVSSAVAALRSEAIPFRATLFDKSRHSNWLVAWHQDTALPLLKKVEGAGWGPWSTKYGIHYAHAPARALEKVVALRIHLDDSGAANGPLRVIPGTHRNGVLSDDTVASIASKSNAVECLLARGGVVVMRPLLIHASSKSVNAAPRRVLHIEYAESLSIGDGLELAIA